LERHDASNPSSVETKNRSVLGRDAEMGEGILGGVTHGQLRSSMIGKHN
jgi:hypothetical protein